MESSVSVIPEDYIKLREIENELVENTNQTEFDTLNKAEGVSSFSGTPRILKSSYSQFVTQMITKKEFKKKIFQHIPSPLTSTPTSRQSSKNINDMDDTFMKINFDVESR